MLWLWPKRGAGERESQRAVDRVGIHIYLRELAKQRGQQAWCSHSRSGRVPGKETDSPGLRVPRGQSSQGEGAPAPSCSLPSEWRWRRWHGAFHSWMCIAHSVLSTPSGPVGGSGMVVETALASAAERQDRNNNKTISLRCLTTSQAPC